jgi:hypothetical protein
MARTPLRPEGIPLSTAAARLVQLLDGQRTTGEAAGELVKGLPPETAKVLASAIPGVIRAFMAEGLFETDDDRGQHDG